MSDLISEANKFAGRSLTPEEHDIWKDIKAALEAKDTEIKASMEIRGSLVRTIARLEAENAEYLRNGGKMLDKIARLEEELDNERAKGIHSCGPDCKRPLCVANKEIARLESMCVHWKVAESLWDKDRVEALEAENERLRAALQMIAKPGDITTAEELGWVAEQALGERNE